MKRDRARILITGVEGFTGRHMLDLLRAEWGAAHITGIHMAPYTPQADSNWLEVVKCDITDYEATAKVVREVSPDIVLHFAGLVSVAGSFSAPLQYLNVNVEGTMNVLEAVRKACPDAKILVPGSAETYGKVEPDMMPIKEDAPQKPKNPYALSKLLQERVCMYYHDSMDLQVYLTRTFHSVGPGQSTGFVCSDFAKQVAEAAKRSPGTIIKVGNVSAKRDFLDVKDLVRAYLAIIDRGKTGYPYNVCSGKSVSVRYVLDTLISLSKAEVTVEVDPAKLRPMDVPEFVGDNSRLQADTSWFPTMPLETTLKDVLAWWRTRSG